MGGFSRSEPFHLTYLLRRVDGSYLKTINLYTNRETIRHHFYIDSSKASLEANAVAWYNARHQTNRR